MTMGTVVPLADELEVARLRRPPHSTAAEQSVLGGLLLDNGAFDRIGDLLTPGDFYKHEHQLIYAAAAGMIVAGKPADVITVFESLQAAGKAGDCGGLVYLNALAQSVPSAANARRYAEIVRERAILRRCIAAADEIATKAFSAASATEVLDLAASVFGSLERAGMRAAPTFIGDLMLGALDRYQALADGSQVPGIATGFRDLDRLLAGGLKAGKVYGIAARPSIGKSSSARSIGIHAARSGHTVLVLSQEMPQEEVADCIVAELGRIDSARLQTGTFSDEDGDWTRIADAVEQARSLPLLIDEQGALTVQDIRARARSVKGLRLLIVDYLQLCATTLKGKSTNDEVAEISKGLKALALELRIPIIVLSQLNREADGIEPTLKHLRDSGAIEQDLDVAVFLWPLDEGTDDIRLIGWKVAKHRGGPKGRFCMRFNAPIYRWDPCEWPPAPAQTARRTNL